MFKSTNKQQMYQLISSLFLGFILLPLSLPVNAACGGKLALQVLGSGGPGVDRHRSSSGYLLWVDGHARILLDAGGGSYARFGNSGARIEDLKLIAISHFHADHAVELPAYIKAGYFTDRQRPLPVAGPTAGNGYPGADDFMRRLFDQKKGAFAYLSGTLNGTEGQFETPVIEVSAESSVATTVLNGPEIRVMAKPVPHGPVPTLAYSIEIDGKKIVYGADQNGNDDSFVNFAKDADLLIMPLAIPEGTTGTADRLHAQPSEVGSIAKNSNARQLLLTHFMPRSEHSLFHQRVTVQTAYGGPAALANDLMCINLDN